MKLQCKNIWLFLLNEVKEKLIEIYIIIFCTNKCKQKNVKKCKKNIMMYILVEIYPGGRVE